MLKINSVCRRLFLAVLSLSVFIFGQRCLLAQAEIYLELSNTRNITYGSSRYELHQFLEEKNDYMQKTNSVKIEYRLANSELHDFNPFPANFLKKLSSLEKLRNLAISLDSRDKFTSKLRLNGIEQLSRLESLSIANFKQLPKDFLPLDSLPDLTEIKFLGCGFEEGCIDSVVSRSKLESIELVECDITSPSIRKFANCPKLTTFVLEAIQIDPLLDSVNEIKSIRNLVLKSFNLDDSSLQSISGLSNLRTLNISKNFGISGVGFKHLAKLENLRTLKVDASFLTDVGMGELVRLDKLVELDLISGELPDIEQQELSDRHEEIRKSGKTDEDGKRKLTLLGFEKLKQLKHLRKLRYREFLTRQEREILEGISTLEVLNGKPFSTRKGFAKYLDEAIEFEKLGKFQDALDCYREAAKDENCPAQGLSLLAIGETLMLEKLGRFEQAATAAKSIQASDFSSTNDDSIAISFGPAKYYRKIDVVFGLLLRNQCYKEAWGLTEDQTYYNKSNCILRQALVRLNQGRFREAELLLESTMKQLVGENTRLGTEYEDPIIFQTCCQLKWLYLSTGQFDKADRIWLLPYNEQFAEGKVTANNGKQPVRNSSARKSNKAGECKAVAYFDELMELVSQYSTTRQDLADQHVVMQQTMDGKYGEALALLNLIDQRDYTDVKNTYNKLGDQTHAALFFRNRAVVLIAKGDLTQAEKQLRKAISILESKHSVGFVETVVTQQILGRVLMAQGRYAEAKESVLETIFGSSGVYGTQHPKTAELHSELADIQFALGEYDDSFASRDRSRKIIRSYVAGALTMLPETVQDQFLRKSYSPIFSTAISHAGWSEETTIERKKTSLEWVLNGKAVAAQTRAEQILSLRRSQFPEVMELTKKLASVRAERAQLEVATLKTNNVANSDRIAELVELESAANLELLDNLRGLNDSSNSTTWKTANELIAALPEQSCLVEIVRYQRKQEPTTPKNRIPLLSYAAWVLSKSGEVQFVDLGPANAIDGEIQKFRSKLRIAPQEIGEKGEKIACDETVSALRSLTQLILRPLLSHMEQHKTWIISPDGGMWLMPWSALLVGDDRFAIENHTIQYVVSGRDLLRPAAKAKRKSPPLVVANPDFDNRNETDSKGSTEEQAIGAYLANRATRFLGGVRVPPLPGTLLEANAAIPKLESLYGVSPVSLLGKDATATKVKNVKRPSAMLLSTHGFFIENGESRQNSSVESDNPLVRCGLLFAGCNRKNNLTDEDQGVLTGLEIVGMDLSGTELVVLSACETGLGDVEDGEGVAGIRQAFQLAGAESIAATLWQIPDEESAQLVEAFFQKLADGNERANSLQLAQMEAIRVLREKRSAAHPYYWAAYTITGK